jgi:hypothetical protein
MKAINAIAPDIEAIAIVSLRRHPNRGFVTIADLGGIEDLNCSHL